MNVVALLSLFRGPLLQQTTELQIEGVRLAILVLTTRGCEIKEHTGLESPTRVIDLKGSLCQNGRSSSVAMLGMRVHQHFVELRQLFVADTTHLHHKQSITLVVAHHQLEIRL